MDEHPSTHDQTPAIRRHVYQNIVLTAIAGLMAVAVLDRGPDGSLVGRAMSPSAALAQADPETPGALANAIQQRKEMIAELRQINARLERMDAKMNSGINVKVTDMPALKLPAELRAMMGPGRAEPSAGSTATVRPAGAPVPAAPAPGASR